MESSRISFDNLLQVVLGSVCNSWGADGLDPVAVAQLIRSVCLKYHDGKESCPAWIHMLADASNSFLSSKGDMRSLNRKLIALGRTRGSTILDDSRVAPAFGLMSIKCMTKLLKTPKYRVSLLRTYAARYFSQADPFDVILRYKVPVASSRIPPLEELEHTDSSIEKSPVTRHKGATGPSSRDSSLRSPGQTSPDLRSKAFFSGVSRRWSPSNKTKSQSRLRGSNLVKQSGNNIVSAVNIEHDEGSYFTTELPVSQQIIGQGNQDLIAEGSALTDQNLDNDIVLTDAPQIEIYPADDNETVPGGAAPTNEMTTFNYATAIPRLISNTSSVTALYRWTNPRQTAESLGEEELAERLICREMPDCCKDFNHKDETWAVLDDSFRKSGIGGEFMDNPAHVSRVYAFFLGDAKTAAMFVDSEELERCKKESGGPVWGRTRRPIKENCDLKDLQAALDADAVDTAEMIAIIAATTKDYKYYESLKALAAAYKIYSGFDGATISPHVVTKPVFGAKWAQRENSISQSRETCLSSIGLLDRLHTFACIAYFESDGLDMNPSQFDNVMALSSGDSIYVAAWLTCDPAERQPANAVHRLHGNVGKAGLILLVPPADPKTLVPGVDNWKFIDRENFDGTVTNAFTGTSLHLSFTDWCIPIDVGEAGRGRRDAEAYIIESLVSVYDRGKWIGDMDVLQALSKGCHQPDHEFFYKPFCDHHYAHTLDPTKSDPPIVTIKNWDEFLEHPKSPAVAMAHGNWDAKLALAVLGVRRGDRVFVADRICEICFEYVSLIGGAECISKALFLL